MLILYILAMVICCKMLGAVYWIGWGIAKGFFGFIGVMVALGLLMSFLGAILLPIVVVVGAVALITRGTRTQ